MRSREVLLLNRSNNRDTPKVSLLTFLSERGTFLEKRRAKGTNRVTKVSDVSEIITVTRRKVSLLTFLFKESK